MANYAIMRIEKRKLGSVGRIGDHHERLKAEYKSNPDIDPSRTHQNYHIVEPPSKYRKAVLDRIEAVKGAYGVKISFLLFPRKDVRMHNVTESRLSAQSAGRTAWLCRTASWAAHRTG